MKNCRTIGEASHEMESVPERRRPYSVLDDLESRTGLLKVKELADIFRVSVDAIYDLADQGTIPSFTIGKQRRFDPRTVAYWIRKKDPTFALAARAA
jgi:excisionase family DNA binding protein